MQSILGHRINTSPQKTLTVHPSGWHGHSEVDIATFIHIVPRHGTYTFDCRESRGGYGIDFGLVGFDQGARINPFPVRLRQPLSRGPGLRSSAHT